MVQQIKCEKPKKLLYNDENSCNFVHGVRDSHKMNIFQYFSNGIETTKQMNKKKNEYH